MKKLTDCRSNNSKDHKIIFIGELEACITFRAENFKVEEIPLIVLGEAKEDDKIEALLENTIQDKKPETYSEKVDAILNFVSKLKALKEEMQEVSDSFTDEEKVLFSELFISDERFLEMREFVGM